MIYAVFHIVATKMGFYSIIEHKSSKYGGFLRSLNLGLVLSPLHGLL